MSRHWRVVLAAIAAAALLFAVVTARLFVWPPRGMPDRVDAIVMLAGPGERLPLALHLARRHTAGFLVVSRGHDGYGSPCPRPVPQVRLICFEPVPATTRGEAEFAGRLARRYNWRSIALVTNTAQDWRARQRMERCFGGAVYVVPAAVALPAWPGQIAYEWAATIKMYALQPGC